MQIDWSKIFSYINKREDRKTIEEVECWRKKDLRNEDFYRRARAYYENNPTRNESFSEEQLDAFYLRMQKDRQRKRQRVWWQRMTAAASILLLISFGTWSYYNQNTYKKSEIRTAMVDNRGAEVIIVTENGDKFTTEQLSSKVVRQISDRKLEYFVPDTIRDADTNRVEERVRTHTVIVPRGRTFELMLPDGTFVLLAPLSELTYPLHFDSCSTREVTLRGEAYFEVTKSSSRFAVNTDRMKLQVYGTIFNILAREDSPDEAVLIKGVIGITPKNLQDGKEIVLHPGDKSSIDGTGRMSVTQTDLAEYVAKRNGFILFNGKTINQMVRSLELYYDIHFVGEDRIPSMQEYVLSVNQHAPLRETLDVIESVANVKFIIEGKEVKIISK